MLLCNLWQRAMDGQHVRAAQHTSNAHMCRQTVSQLASPRLEDEREVDGREEVDGRDEGMVAVLAISFSKP
jgi:hypothetical protein